MKNVGHLLNSNVINYITVIVRLIVATTKLHIIYMTDSIMT